MLHLAAPTRSDWIEDVVSDLNAVLIDHAHCEKKAASTALSLLFRYPERAALQRPLTALAKEELTHFELMLDVLDARGLAAERQHPSRYAARLMKGVRREEPQRLLDTLLALALIEARSCERMRILAAQLPDAALRALYGSLLASEARHHMLYVDLAKEMFDEDQVRARLADMAAHEALVLATSTDPPRMHS